MVKVRPGPSSNTRAHNTLWKRGDNKLLPRTDKTTTTRFKPAPQWRKQITPPSKNTYYQHAARHPRRFDSHLWAITRTRASFMSSEMRWILLISYLPVIKAGICAAAINKSNSTCLSELVQDVVVHRRHTATVKTPRLKREISWWTSFF